MHNFKDVQHLLLKDGCFHVNVLIYVDIYNEWPLPLYWCIFAVWSLYCETSVIIVLTVTVRL